ncbi:ABC transporter permease [Natronoarchaeum mannanilyticum]|uniref:ABC3 transporter permease C-terminal domain-containing protein n=2 Tax=Natronoarchaeum mannanilyticum TaxID=926360 RepID=A0AAV3TAQ9_9EURY
MRDDGDRRRSRWRGLFGISATRLWKQATTTRTGRMAASTGAVALTIAILLVVTGIALALANAGVVSQADAEATVVPERGETLSDVGGVEPAQLGAANERAAQLREREGVDHASPVLVETVRLESAGGGDGDESGLVLLVGVVPDDEERTVAGLPTTGLEPGDPHYADGSYDGPRTGELVLSDAAAERLDAAENEEFRVAGNRTATDRTTFGVAEIDAAAGNERDADVPVALVHLSELQSISGASAGELADRVLVWGDADAAAAAGEDAYPNATVETAGGTDPSQLFDDGLAFATSLIALVVGVAICAAFVATTMGITVNEDRRMLAVLEAIGFPTHSRLAVVGVSTLVTTLLGAVLGIVGGVLGVLAVDAVAGATVASRTVAIVHPLFVPYAFAVALVSGLVAVPYPLVVAARTNVLEEVGR